MGRRGFTTRQVHERAPQAAATPRATPIYLTAGFEFDEYEQAAAHFGQGEGYAYTRIGNPTIETVEHTLAALEGGSQALLLATGQAATSVALLALLESGQHVVSSAHIYEGTRGLLRDNLSRLGITTTFVDDIRDLGAWEAAIRPEPGCCSPNPSPMPPTASSTRPRSPTSRDATASLSSSTTPSRRRTSSARWSSARTWSSTRRASSSPVTAVCSAGRSSTAAASTPPGLRSCSRIWLRPAEAARPVCSSAPAAMRASRTRGRPSRRASAPPRRR